MFVQSLATTLSQPCKSQNTKLCQGGDKVVKSVVAALCQGFDNVVISVWVCTKMNIISNSIDGVPSAVLFFLVLREIIIAPKILKGNLTYNRVLHLPSPFLSLWL